MKALIKTLLTLCIFVFTASTLNAQKNTSILGAFVSMPIGDFGSTDLANGSYAQTGWGIAFDSRFLIKTWPENFYLLFHSSYQWNNVDNAAIAQDYTEILGNKTTVSESRYSPIITSIGPKYDIPLTNKLALGLHAGAGIMFTNTKSMTIKVYDINDALLLSENINFDNDPAFTYRFAVDLTLQLVPDILDLSLFADYTGAQQNAELSSKNLDPISSSHNLQYLNTGLLLVLKAK